LSWSSSLLGVVAAVALGADFAGSAEVPRFAGGTTRVLLTATAVDGKGRPVRDLKAGEFRVFEQGRPQRIVHFSSGGVQPARLLLLADASGSMNGGEKLASVRMAVTQLLADLGEGDEVALAGFDSRYFGLVPFTTSRERILSQIAELTPFGSTALHDALDRAAADLASHGEGRRALVVLTDGVDNASERRPEEVVARSRALDVPIYAISVVSPLDDPDSTLFVGAREKSRSEATKGAETLTRYAELSGGGSFTVSDFRGLKLAAGQILAEVKHQYRIGYEPPTGPEGFRRVEVRTTRRGVAVRTRSGYLPAS
jgi:Ca-activated chloride channel family protein